MVTSVLRVAEGVKYLEHPKYNSLVRGIHAESKEPGEKWEGSNIDKRACAERNRNQKKRKRGLFQKGGSKSSRKTSLA